MFKIGLLILGIVLIPYICMAILNHFWKKEDRKDFMDLFKVDDGDIFR